MNTQEAEDQQRVERLAALILTIPNYPGNYTKALDDAKWIIKEAERVGWRLDV